VQSFAHLPLNSDVRYLVRQVAILATHLLERQRTPLLMSQKIVQLLFKSPNQLGREVYVMLLQQLCELYDEVGKEAVNWLLFSDDDRKYHIPVTVILLRSSLLPITLFDQALAKTLFSDPRPILQNFTAGLIRECLTIEPPVASQDQLTLSIEVLVGLEQKTAEYVLLPFT
jgi:CCR4-NOT transcription complex subunit 1